MSLTISSIVTWNMFLVLFAAMVLHELGHWLYIKKKQGSTPRAKWYYENWHKWGFRWLSNPMTREQYKNGLLVGIVLGMLPLFFAHNFIVAVVLYFGGCRADLLRLINIISNEEV